MSQRDGHRQRQPNVPGGPPFTERQTRTLELSNEVSPNTTASNPETVDVDTPWDCVVLQADVNWPSGSQGQAGVKLGTATGRGYVPYNEGRGFLASDDFGTTFFINDALEEGRTLRAEFINQDGTNAHLINVFVQIALNEELAT